MAKIIATWQPNEQGEIQLTANRKGQCAGCKQEKSCALQLQPNQAFQWSSKGEAGVAGTTTEVTCSDSVLLSYQATLYVPTLVALLLIAIIAALPSLQAASPLLIGGVVVLVLAVSTVVTRLLLKRKEDQGVRFLESTDPNV